MCRRIGFVILITTISQTPFAYPCKKSLTENGLHEVFYPDISSTLQVKFPTNNHRNVDKYNRLTKAAYEGDLKRVKHLVEARGFSVNQQHNVLGYTSLMFSVGSGHTSVVEYLLENDEIDVNQVNDLGATALMEALGEDITIFKLILNHPKIDVNKKDTIGMTALILASRFGALHYVRLLLQKPGVDITLYDDERNTALVWASREGHFDVTKAILGKYKSF